MAIRTEDFDRTIYLLRLLYVVFSLLYKPVYLRAIGFQFLLLKYHQGNFIVSFSIFSLEIGHPNLHMQRQNFVNVNGEDIELASRELSMSHLSTRGRSDVISFYISHLFRLRWLIDYRLLGIMWSDSKLIHMEQSDFKSLAGYTNNDGRLVYDDEILHQKVSVNSYHLSFQAADWFESIYDDFKSDSFKHYKMIIKHPTIVCLSCICFYILAQTTSSLHESTSRFSDEAN